MRLLARFVLSSVSNLVALFAAVYLVPGFEITFILPDFLWTVGILTALNVIIAPILKFVFGPLIFLTLGALTVIINAAMLWLLDFLSSYITINGLLPLIYATLIISLVNIVINLSARLLYRK